MKEYGRLGDLIVKIETMQKGKEGLPEYNIGEQLKDIARAEPASAELIDQDLDKEGMALADVAKAFQKYADEENKKSKSKCVCITPLVAEGLIRKFYGLPDRGAVPAVEKSKEENLLDLSDFI